MSGQDDFDGAMLDRKLDFAIAMEEVNEKIVDWVKDHPVEVTGVVLTRQGVRDLNDKPKNGRRRSIQEDCTHDEWRHVSDCTGCWAEQFGGYDHAAHTYECRRCGLFETR